MKRYEVHDDCYGDQVEDEISTGPWVKYEDAQAAIQEAVLAEREALASWIEVQRNLIPATGEEFAAAIRARSTP